MMPLSCVEEMLDEVNPLNPFAQRCFERDAIVEREEESTGCVSTSAPSSLFVCLCLYALGASEIPPQDGEL